MSDLDARLLAADAAGNLADLTGLYIEAADAAKDEAAAGFFLTQAYVFALEAGLPQAETLRTRLIAMGRDRRH